MPLTAQLALMEWSDAYGDLVTLSIHTFERAPQLAAGLPERLVPVLATDPASRCAALLLPEDAIAVLPLYQDVAELDVGAPENREELRTAVLGQLPYAPSFVLSLGGEVDSKIRNVRDLAFLPGFQKPTLAVLYEPDLTWTGQLSKARQTMRVSMITLDLTIARYPSTATSDLLPYDALFIVACPAAIGGVLVVTASALIHMDQTAKLVGVAVNAWFERTADMTLPRYTPPSGAPLDLRDSQLLFTSGTGGLLFPADGTAYSFRCTTEGRSVTGIELSPVSIPDEAPRCAFACGLPGEERAARRVLCASLQGDTRLYGVSDSGARADSRGGVAHAVKPGAASAPGAAPMDEGEDMDAHLYGNTQNEAPAAARAPAAPAALAPDTMDEDLELYGESAAAPASTVAAAAPADALVTLDSLPTLAPIASVARGELRDEYGQFALRTIAASGRQLLALEPRLRLEQRGAAIAPAQHVWHVPTSGGPLVFAAGSDECLVYALAAQDEAQFLAQLPGATRHCAPDPAGRGALRISSACVELVGANGTVTHVFGQREPRAASDEANAPAAPTIVHAATHEDHVALLWSDGAVRLWRGGGDRWTAAAAPSGATYAQLDLYHDARGALAPRDAGRLWLVLATRRGEVELHVAGTAEPRWRSRSARVLPSRLNVTTRDAPAQDAELAGVDIAQLCLADVGDLPTLVVLYENHQLAAFEARPTADESEPQDATSAGFLTLGFVRAEARMLRPGAGPLTPTTLGPHAAVAVPGTPSVVAMRDAKAALRFVEVDVPLKALCARHGADPYEAAAVLNGEAALIRWEPACRDAPVAYRRWATGREYTHVACHRETGSLVAASTQPQAFVLFNDEDVPVEEPGADPSTTYSERGALELFGRLGEAPVHGYEFAANETVCALHTGALDTQDRASGRRELVLVGTVSAYGEDRTAAGHMYVFDVIEAVRYADDRDGDSLRLRLLCREEMRGPVTALGDMNGYAIAAVGQKLLVRSLEHMEWLVTVAFLDTAYYTSDIQRVKNYLLLTDYHRGAWFVVFQEEPAQLHLLGRDHYPARLVAGGLLIQREKLALVTADRDGCLRLLDYNPSNPTSQGGQRLLVRTEYHNPGEVATALVLHGRSEPSGERTSSEVLLACRNGALDVLVPVEERIFQVLQLFQSQLLRSVRHTAGLNPRGFRAVMNEHVSRPLAKGILDGHLLHAAECMSRPKLALLVQDLRMRTGGVSADGLLHCLEKLYPWS